MKSTLLILMLAIAVAGLASGCTFKNYKEGGQDAATTQVRPSFKSLQSRVFTSKCISCHQGANAPKGVNFESYSRMMSLKGLVVPFDPENSALYRVAADGSMPKGQRPLSKIEVNALYQWIKSGAPEVDGSTAPTPIPEEPIEANFKSIQSHVFGPKCVYCHSGANPPHGLDFTSYSNILNSPMFPPLIVRGKPQASSLYLAVFNGKMPKDSAHLSKAELDALYAWIENGAKENESDPLPSPSPGPSPGGEPGCEPGCEPGEPGCEVSVSTKPKLNEPCDMFLFEKEPGAVKCPGQ